jgi:archaemetzincin
MERLEQTFKGFQTKLERRLSIQAEWFDRDRRQYNSTKILQSLSTMIKGQDLSRVLGVTSLDLYVPSLNFVFGEAQCPGNVAVISTCRLDPKFYGQTDRSLLFQRALKEAVHELGHTFGMGHCKDHICVMFFSNSIYDTDRKHEKFCHGCSELVKNIIESR